MNTRSSANTLGLAKLAASGLSASDAVALGIHFLEPAEVVALHGSFRPLPAVLIPYGDPFRPGEPLRPWPCWPPFYRLRYLGSPNDFSRIAGKAAPRYAQEPGSGVCAYFPTLGVDWPSVLQDPDAPLIITEGELKAAAACAAGFPTVGLGGVYSYRSSALGLTFLDELASVVWVKRNVYVIFDSDYRANPQVCSALDDLAHELMRRGAMPHTVSLPDLVEDGKTGLDDFLVINGRAELLDALRDRSQELTLARDLWSLNDDVVYARDPGLIVVRVTGQRLSPRNFRDHAFSARPAAERVVRKDGTISMKQVSAAESWLRWPLRAEVGGMTYAPGRPQTVDEGEPWSRWNVWPGWGVEPRAGDVSPWLELVDRVFEGAELSAREWFVSWCACPLQRPGTKMFSAAVVHGVRHGTGKSLIGYALGAIYGRNFAEIKQADLNATFNEWAENRQFVLADDITGSTRRQDADLLKKLITQREVRINPKYVPSYTVPDCINYYFTSNQPDAFFLEDDDRRFFVHEVVGAPLPQEFYREFDGWMRGGGPAALFAHLLKVDLGDFDPAAAALRTRAKELMTADVKSDLGSWVAGLRADPDHALRVGDVKIPGDLFTSSQLLAVYDPSGRTGTTANGLARELRRAGFALIRGGLPLATSDGQARYYAVRNSVGWASCAPREAQEHVERTLLALKGVRERRY